MRQFRRTQLDPDTELRSKVPLPVWLVTLINTEGVKEKIYNLTGLFNLKIKVENYIGTPSPVQCFRCQKFGHKLQGCNLQPKCVKCAGEHNTKEAQKTLFHQQHIPTATDHTGKLQTVPEVRRLHQAFHPNITIHAYTLPIQPKFPETPNTQRTHPQLQKTRTDSPKPPNSTGNDLKDIIDLLKSFN